MEYVLLIIVLVLFLAVVFIKEAYVANREEKRFKESLYKDYGVPFQKEYSPERFEHIKSYYLRHKEAGQIDDITWNDLNMDDIFKRINDTLSASGEEYLYYTLRSVGTDRQKLEHLEQVIRFFENHADERVTIQMLMRKLGYTGKFSLYDYLEHLDNLGRRSGFSHIWFDLLFIPLIIMAPFQLPMALFGFAVLMSYNIITYFKEKREIEPYIISFVYIIRLLSVSEELIKVKAEVCSKEWQEIKAYKDALSGIRTGSSIVLKNASATTSGNPTDIIMDYVRMVFHIDLILFDRMLSKLRAHIDEVDGLITKIGYVETAIAIGSFRHSLKEGFCVPELTEDRGPESSELEIQNGYHPLLSHPVKNSFFTEKGILLTGSNASGKSTFLKMVAVNAILAQTIHTCAANAYRAPFFSIYSSMSLRDNLENGESYYIVEIKALKRIIQHPQEVYERRVLCFVDEVLRGTNTVERIAATTQILKSLANQHFMCFAATHDIELTELLKDEYHNYHFEEEIKEGDISFNYKLLKGKATTRNAIRLLEIMGYDEEIIRHATRQAEHFIEFGVW